jgi:hypothetical protein
MQGKLGVRGQSAGSITPESGDWRVKIKLHTSDAIAGEGIERFVDLARPMF